MPFIHGTTDRASDVSAADWLSQTHEKLPQLFMRGDTVFLSGGNPCKALQFISKTV